MTLGTKLSSHRRNLGISQEALAEMSGISIRTIQRIEKDISSPRPHTLKVLANSLDIEIDSLSPIKLHQKELSRKEISLLKLMNLSSLCFILLPFGNIFMPLVVLLKNKQHPEISEPGKKIISVQLIWSITTLVTLISVQMIILIITGSVAIGRLPIPFLAIVNIVFILYCSLKLNSQNPDFLEYFPSIL
jgi:transcriptional regulator with XRE-family HTH domain